MTIPLWLPLAATVLGVIAHSASADGGASILDHFGVDWRLPKWALALTVAVATIASGCADNVLAGQDWKHALLTAATTFVAATFGVIAHHGASSGGKGGPPAGAAAGLFFLAIFGCVMTTGCAAFLHEARVVTEEMGTCLVAHADLPDDKAFEACGLATGIDEAQRQLLLAMLHEHRRQAAKEAVDAAERAEKEALSKILAQQLAAEAHAKCAGGKK